MGPVTLAGDLAPGRPFRMAVADRALGVWVAPARPDGAPFVAIVNHPVASLDDLAELDAVARFVLAGEQT